VLGSEGTASAASPSDLAPSNIAVVPTSSAPELAPGAGPVSGPPAPSPQVDDDYEDVDASAGIMGVLPELATTGDPLTIRRKLELLVPLADALSGAERYAAVATDIEYEDPTHSAYQRVHHGLHWGLLGLTQRSGFIGKVLLAAQRRDAASLQQIFGAGADLLIARCSAPQPEERLRPVEGAFLWQSPWLERFRAAGAQAAVQAAQNEVAIEQLVDAQLPFAAALGLTSDRALGLLVACSVRMGIGGGRRFVLDALSPIGEELELRARALALLGSPDLASFQSRMGLPADGRWTSETHAILLGALRALGTAPELDVPALPVALDRLVQAALGRRSEALLGWLRTTPAYTDRPLQIG
jgi:hypothetical protein